MAVTGAAGAGPHRQGRPRRKAGGHAVIDQALGKAGAAQRLDARPASAARLPPLAAAADHRLGLGDGAGGVRGAADRDAPAERAVEQGRGRQQIGVAVALDDAVGKAGHDRALRQDAARHALEADLRFAGGQA